MFHIVFNADENYIKYNAVLITSIILQAHKANNGSDLPPPPAQSTTQNLEDEGYCFHILSDSLQPSTLTKLANLESSLQIIYPCKILVHFLDDKDFKDLPKRANRTNYSNFFRIKLASVLPEIDKCLYLDVDMLVIGDLRELFALDLGENIAGVVLDCSNPYRQKSLKARDSTRADFTFPFREEYFNSGFMLINLPKWRELDIQGKALEFVRNFTTNMDQDILNAVIGNQTLKLPPKWNLFVNHFTAQRLGRQDNFCADESKNCLFGYTSKELQESLKDIRIVHFTFLCAKPWENECKLLDTAYLPLDYPYYKQWWEVAKQTPIFKEELESHLQTLQNNALQDYAKALSHKLIAHRNQIQNLSRKSEELFKSHNKILQRHFLGAKQRVENHLSYKIGKEIQNSQKSILRITLPLKLGLMIYHHKKALKDYQTLCAINPSLKLPLLQEYQDFDEAVHRKNCATYQLGEEFLKSCKKWYRSDFIKFLFHLMTKS
ncbi:glycosyltransferase family 8 protein [Helicobacter sp. MIT 05-5294]|uniref:glycosyltransferase family 8 protein n=1 Tax=Helicobacter sp. MIT 05-5294 TaxID=1548150 RepID=UPI0010FF48DF|nr:glycosyltransferase family 8 protein [Helicobacter sp. MIT 05-5294]TLD87549.1 glycosyltransferase family 8 protein [Helicobacter sp. MIT 05-5294]